MNKKITIILAAIFFSMISLSTIPEANAINNRNLNAKQRAIVPIAAFTAQGDMPRLTEALNEGLDAGLTINETKEVLVQLYAYAGFPRSLNAINNLMAVIKDREARGIKDEVGRAASPIRTDKTLEELGAANRAFLMGGRPVSGPTYEFSPEIDYFLKAHLFGDIFERDVLDFKAREVATVATLASLGGVDSQLRGHISNSLAIGITEDQLRDLVNVLRAKVGATEANTATTALNTVMSSRK